MIFAIIYLLYLDSTDIASDKMKMCFKIKTVIIYGIILTIGYLPILQGQGSKSCQYLEEILDLNDTEKSQYNLKRKYLHS